MTLEPAHNRARDQARGCLLGGAVGDALGAPVEFLSTAEICARYGPLGIVDYDVAYGRIGAITDDTQMTLFTAEGLLRGRASSDLQIDEHQREALVDAYYRWLITQRGDLPYWMTPADRQRILGDDEHAHSWLLDVAALHNRRAPGATCLTALESPKTFANGYATNTSKGCGGVMRVAPVALMPGWTAARAYQIACMAAHVTHGHATGYVAAGAFAHLVVNVRDGASIADAVARTVHELPALDPASAETRRALEQAVALFESGQTPSPALVEQLGGGWIAEEALAIGVCCELVAPDDFARGITLAVNHSGDSDSTGSITGQILGLRLGVDAIQTSWLERLELRDVITQLADDCMTGVREDAAWRHRHPTS